MGHISLQNIYNRKKTDRDIFQELMPFKVQEILVVATYYDAYSIVREGQFFDKIFGEYLQLNLYAAPRFTSVSTREEALNMVRKRNFQMVILMAGLDKVSPLDLAQEIKEIKSEFPVLLLVNNNSDLRYFYRAGEMSRYVDRAFVWNGDSKVFLAMSKYVEDYKNVEKDSRIGDVRIILLVEDSPKYYTRYLPLLYSIVMRQTQEIINEEGVDELRKILKMRARPKILLCTNYEEAEKVVEKYLDNLLCVISDVKYERNGIPDDNAGVDLLSFVQERGLGRIPCLLQSSNIENRQKAEEMDVEFIDKNSDSLSHDIYDFIVRRLGFGDFVFKNSRGIKIDTAHTLAEFEEKIQTIPPECLLYHSRRNGISTWLMARGEINMATRLRPYRIEDFQSTSELRQAILNVFEHVRVQRLKGRVVKFHKDLLNRNRFIIRLANGSLGGKGRGMAFISNFIENIDFKKILPQINIRIPATAIIGVNEFDRFIERNNLYQKIYIEQEYQEVREHFAKSELGCSLKEKLQQYIEVMDKPLAVRSSGLFEDSLLQPFAGVYATYLLPNNHPDPAVRLEQLEMAIKLVYASIFSESAKNYFEAVHYKIEEEKMAVIIQELVGEVSHDRFYPHISGVAQSYNYYPFAYMEPEDGFSVTAVGLGMYVVGGEKSHRFCPQYPKLELKSLPDQIKDSQTYFYALDMSHEVPFDLLKDDENASIVKLNIKEAEEDGNLKYCAQVYDFEYDRLINNFSKRGVRVVNFANILLYEHIPLADTLKVLLNYFSEAMGAPVEIEYAVDLNPGQGGLPTFYLLQIKPLIQREMDVEVNLDEVDEELALLIARKGMGNGKVDTIRDVIYMDIDKFNRTQTDEMAKEVAELNTILEKEGKEYILIGPGRWGTRDRFTGIPVLWSHIANAKVIVEMGLKNFPLDASLGSHFFHNVTSMNVGYFSIPFNSSDHKLNFDVLKKQKVIHETSFFKHVEFEKPLNLQMDGKRRTAVITFDPDTLR